MARSIDTIFNQMVAQKQSTPALSSLTSSSSTAIWRLLLYVVAFCINVHERLWDTYRTEVNAAIEQMLPHRPKWYRDKALAFMRDKTLIPDTDRYDTTGMSDDDIAAAQVVKHATANENEQSSLLIIKVAGEDSSTGKRTPITSTEQTQLSAYLQAVKDAGVRISLVNQPADRFRCTVDIYYDPTKDPATVQYDCENAIRNYVENLPFNGEYSNMALIDALQAIDGVRIAELQSAESTPAATSAFATINAYVVPAAGYFAVDNATLNMIAYNL